jgi:hypothetical protein
VSKAPTIAENGSDSAFVMGAVGVNWRYMAERSLAWRI